MRRNENLIQREAVAKMRKLDKKGRGVSVWTWSRWENGVRLPPRTKIDLVAAVVNIDSRRVRRRAGYHVPERAIRRDRNDVVAAMLSELSCISLPEARMLRLYAIIDAYIDYGDSGRSALQARAVNVHRMQVVARVFDDLKALNPGLFDSTVRRIREICKEVGGGGQVVIIDEGAVLNDD